MSSNKSFTFSRCDRQYAFRSSQRAEGKDITLVPEPHLVSRQDRPRRGVAGAEGFWSYVQAVTHLRRQVTVSRQRTAHARLEMQYMARLRRAILRLDPAAHSGLAVLWPHLAHSTPSAAARSCVNSAAGCGRNRDACVMAGMPSAVFLASIRQAAGLRERTAPDTATQCARRGGRRVPQKAISAGREPFTERDFVVVRSRRPLGASHDGPGRPALATPDAAGARDGGDAEAAAHGGLRHPADAVTTARVAALRAHPAWSTGR